MSWLPALVSVVVPSCNVPSNCPSARMLSVLSRAIPCPVDAPSRLPPRSLDHDCSPEEESLRTNIPGLEVVRTPPPKSIDPAETQPETMTLSWLSMATELAPSALTVPYDLTQTSRFCGEYLATKMSAL